MGQDRTAYSSKKAMFFTLVALTIVSILLVMFSRSVGVVRESGSPAIRVKAIDSFLSDVESSYLPLAARTAGYKAIQATIARVNSTGQYLSAPESDLGGVMLNGTLGTASVMANNTFWNYTRQIEALASSTYSLNLVITLRSARMNQSIPWRIDIVANMSYVAAADVGNWTRSGLITTSIPVEGFLDPQYLVRSNGAYQQRIWRSSISSTQWNISRLDAFVSAGNYTRFEGSTAPSFLGRFMSSPPASSCCGIESTINPAKVSPSSQQESYADYQFWASSEECNDLYTISGGGFSHSNFRLDFEHVAKYNVTAYATALTCT